MISLRSVSSLSERQLPGAARPFLFPQPDNSPRRMTARRASSGCLALRAGGWLRDADITPPKHPEAVTFPQPGANLVPIRRTRRQAAEATPPLEGPRLPPFPHALPTSHPHIAHIAPWIEETER